MKRVVIILAAVIVIVAAFFFFTRGGDVEAGGYRFVTVEQGDLESVVSSTGALGAVTTVQVGTQVSGIISKIFVDFNDRVRQGQTIALIDTTLLGSAVREAAANLERTRAQLVQAEREYKRVEPLFEKELVAEVAYNQAQYDLDIARAAYSGAVNGLARAQQNLEYATIRAPISGTVIERNVDPGQTVAASFSAPQLFLIANDLAEMQILASVDESDIGQIETGQEVRFTVQAYPEETFSGKVRQVRLQSTTEENVVNYTAVVDVSNDDGRLLPGMTATVDFIIKTANDVMKVSNAALRFRPSEDMIAAFREKRQQQRAEREGDGGGRPGDAQAGQTPSGEGGRSGEGTGGGRGDAQAGPSSGGSAPQAGGGRPGGGGLGGPGGRRNFTLLWYVDEAGEVTALPARTGITDGQFTEVRARGLEPGMQIISSMTATGGSRSNNPFQQQSGGRRRLGGF